MVKLWVATERAGQTNVLPLPMPEVSHIHLQPTEVPEAVAETLPFPTELPDWSRAWNERQIDYRNYVFELEKNTSTPDTTRDAAEEEQVKEWARLPSITA